jgi:hypothetical protein
MSQLVYSTINSGYSSTQAYLGTVKVCLSCKTQKPKGLFKMLDGEELCKECYNEVKELIIRSKL